MVTDPANTVGACDKMTPMRASSRCTASDNLTMSPCHHVTVSSCHHVTMSPCHRVTVSPCHRLYRPINCASTRTCPFMAACTSLAVALLPRVSGASNAYSLKK